MGDLGISRGKVYLAIGLGRYALKSPRNALKIDAYLAEILGKKGINIRQDTIKSRQSVNPGHSMKYAY